ncbi:MAG: hypothetical protein AB8G95_03730 [Anaerolineae bacterium]
MFKDFDIKMQRPFLITVGPMIAASFIFLLGFVHLGQAQTSAAIACLDSVANSGFELYLPLISNNVDDSLATFESADFKSQIDLNEISIGDVISDQIVREGDCNQYSFAVSADETIFFDAQEVPNNNIEWELTDGGGHSLFRTCLSCSPLTEEIDTPGTYTLTVGSGTGAYQFQLWAVPDPQIFDIEVGATVSPNQPQQGAGMIESPVAADVYRFNGVAGQLVFFDVQMVTQTQGVSWELVDTQGASLFSDCLLCGDKGPIELTSIGTYTLTVGGNINAGTGMYQIELVESSLPSHFMINIGDRVSPGQPEAGAGEIETPGSKDVYTFDAMANQVVFFDIEVFTGTGSISWELEDPFANTLFFDCLACGDPGAIELMETGTYSLTVGRNSNSATGSYQFSLTEVAPNDQFEIEIGDTVSLGQPADGAGSIEQAGTFDIYTFEAVSQTMIFADMQVVSPGLTVQWKLNDSSGLEIFRDCVACGDPGTHTLMLGGTYTLTVGSASSTGTGNYQFQIWDVPPPVEFPIAVGDVISPNLPAAGAGIIETPGSVDVYTFSGTAGEKVTFDIQATNGTGGIRWELRDPNGTELFDQAMSRGDVADVTLPANGQYRLSIGHNRFDQTGTYQFQLLASP